MKVGGGIKSGAMATANATLNTAARIYGISSEDANLMAYRVARASVDLQAGLGVGIGAVNSLVLPPNAPSITTGVPIIDFMSSSTSYFLGVGNIGRGL